MTENVCGFQLPTMKVPLATKVNFLPEIFGVANKGYETGGGFHDYYEHGKWFDKTLEKNQVGQSDIYRVMFDFVPGLLAFLLEICENPLILVARLTHTDPTKEYHKYRSFDIQMDWEDFSKNTGWAMRYVYQSVPKSITNPGAWHKRTRFSNFFKQG